MANTKHKVYRDMRSLHLTAIKDTGSEYGFDLMFIADPMRSGGKTKGAEPAVAISTALVASASSRSPSAARAGDVVVSLRRRGHGDDAPPTS